MEKEDCLKFLETLDAGKSWQENLIRLSALGYDLIDESAALRTYADCLVSFQGVASSMTGMNIEDALKFTPLFEKAMKLKAACRAIAANGGEEAKAVYAGLCERLDYGKGFKFSGEDAGLCRAYGDGREEYSEFINKALTAKTQGKAEH